MQSRQDKIVLEMYLKSNLITSYFIDFYCFSKLLLPSSFRFLPSSFFFFEGSPDKLAEARYNSESEKQIPDKRKYLSCKVGYFSIAFKISEYYYNKFGRSFFG